MSHCRSRTVLSETKGLLVVFGHLVILEFWLGIGLTQPSIIGLGRNDDPRVT